MLKNSVGLGWTPEITHYKCRGYDLHALERNTKENSGRRGMEMGGIGAGVVVQWKSKGRKLGGPFQTQVSPIVREALYTRLTILNVYASRFVFPRVLWCMWIVNISGGWKKKSHLLTNLRSIVINTSRGYWLQALGMGLQIQSHSCQGHSGNNMQWFPNTIWPQKPVFLTAQRFHWTYFGSSPVCNYVYISKYVHTFIYLSECIF